MSDVTSEDVQMWIMTKADDTDLKLLQDIISMKMRIQFKVGDAVWFDAKTRGIIHGTVTKMNSKSANVRAANGVQWKVSPALLNRDTVKSGV